MKRTVLAIVLLTAAVIVAFFLKKEDIAVLIYKEDTVYAGKYNENNFRSIKIGSSQTCVRELLGDPLRTVDLTSPPRTCWIYADGNTNSSIHNFRIRNIEFDEKKSAVKKEVGLYVD